MYNFYIRMDGQQFGPFSATQIVNQYLDELESLNDIEVMEESIGMWCAASEYPWDELVEKERKDQMRDLLGRAQPAASTTQSYSSPSPTQSTSNSGARKMNIFIILWLLAVAGYYGYHAVDSFISPLVEYKEVLEYMKSLRTIMILTGAAYVLTALGAILLLFRKRYGLSMIGSASTLIVGICVYLHAKYDIPLDLFKEDIIAAVIIPFATYGILQIKENGVSCWDSLDE